MHVLYEEAAKFHTGRLMSEADASAQVELATGKRVKVKLAQLLLKFAAPDPAVLLEQAQAGVSDVDLSLAWECAPDDAFGFAALAAEYFGANASLVQQVTALLALHGAPHYFRRMGKGQFKKADAQTVALALAAIEKRKQQQLQIEQWAADLVAGSCPGVIAQQLYKILFKPDKNGPEYKAVALAARIAQQGVLPLLQAAGAIRSPYEFHWQRFLAEAFPKGTGFGNLAAPPIDASQLPFADVQAVSIDDSQTTEIDDAMSVQGVGSGRFTLGIHIAAPGLAFAPGDAVDTAARERMSTVYMPGHKLTMLPDSVVQHYTLQEGKVVPALSLYVEFDEATWAVRGSRTQIERISMARNLRHDQLGDLVTEDWIVAPTPSERLGQWSGLPGHQVMGLLYRLAKHLKAQREVVRGKPESFNRPDYNFRLLREDSGAGPSGEETVEISVRPRGEPLDLIVAECMILANNTWGSWLAQCGVPGIYRSQASLAPGVKVRMGTKALPHAGIGVSAYAWSTSPLRRYADLVNQWQLIACARHGATAALVAPFKPKDAQLFAIVSGFDAAYSGYNTFQNGMERYWTLKALQQQGLPELEATVIKDQPGAVMLRADAWPLVLPLQATGEFKRGDRLRVAVQGIDLISLDAHAQLRERLGGQAELDNAADEDEADSAGPIALAIDVNEPSAGEEGAPAPV